MNVTLWEVEQPTCMILVKHQHQTSTWSFNNQKLSTSITCCQAWEGQELLALNAPKFCVKLWSVMRFFSFNVPKFNTKLWRVKFLALQSLALNFGAMKGFFFLCAPKLSAIKMATKIKSLLFNGLFLFNIPKFDTELWSAESFFFLSTPKLGIKLWKVKSFMFLAFQTLVSNYGTLSKKKDH